MAELVALYAIGSIVLGLVVSCVAYRLVKRMDRIRRVCDAEIERYRREMRFEDKE